MRQLWFAAYLQAYLERDVRAATAVKDLATFRRFLALLASRHGQMLNKTGLAAPLGVSAPTIAQWLGVLETIAQLLIVPPFYENLGKRLVKSPKVCLADSGLACHLPGIETAGETCGVGSSRRLRIGNPRCSRLEVCATIALLAVAVCFTPLRARASAPLLSWNDGQAKQSIIEFVEKVTKPGSPDFVPPAERTATFDNDGTL